MHAYACSLHWSSVYKSDYGNEKIIDLQILIHPPSQYCFQQYEGSGYTEPLHIQNISSIYVPLTYMCAYMKVSCTSYMHAYIEDT